MSHNLFLNTDSYKMSHYKCWPPGTEYVSAYIESRGGKWDQTVMFGLQYIIKKYLLDLDLGKEEFVEAMALVGQHGLPFNTEGFRDLMHLGYLPLHIQAIPEGTVVNTGNVLIQIINTGGYKFYWLPSFLETLLLRVWYPITVATKSFKCKQIIKHYLDRTSDEPDNGQLDFKLHDFGARGASSFETASIGGCAHLVNFRGSDTISGILMARDYYHEPMAGFSISAAEHATITSWGREHEVDAYRNMLTQFAQPGKTLAVVSDSYDIFHAIDEIWGKQLKQEVINSGATLVIRPDSGQPVAMVRETLRHCMDAFGYITNKKGYDVLPPYIRVIQGDGVDLDSIEAILKEITAPGNMFSADNIAFGMGGALLQNLNRDNLRFAMKTSAVCVNGKWRDVWKDPITDPGKKSKRGRLALVKLGKQYHTVTEDNLVGFQGGNQLVDIFKDGVLLKDWTLQEIRDRANEALNE
jgi:nicotinamide phosphoribosyltransferase